MEVQEMRQVFIDSAVRVVARDGMEKTTTKAIASEAKLNEAYIYKCFSGKDDLLSAALHMEDVNFANLLQKTLPIMHMPGLSWKERAYILWKKSWDLILSKVVTTAQGEKKHLCRCDCGTERYVLERSLKSGGSLSCGCLRRERAQQATAYGLLGKTFGELRVVGKSRKRTRMGAYWTCLCSCGYTCEATASELVSGRKTNCGCKNVKNYASSDITGQRFGRLTAQYSTKKRDAKGFVIWHCHCDCGNETDVSYENRRQYKKPREEWVVVENTHEPLIDRETFDKVQELARRKNAEYFENLGRFTHLETTENILKGLVCCADCKRPLVRYKNVSHEKKLWYTFICPTHANDIGSCPLKNIREDALSPMLLQAIQTQIALAADMEAIVRRVNGSPKYKKQTTTLQGKLDAAKRALKRYNGLYDSLYQNYVDKLMTEQEYMTLKRRYKAEAEEAERLIEALTRRQAAEAAHTPENPFLAAFGSFRGADALTKEMAQALIERVYVDGDSNIEIVFRYRDEYKELCTYLEGRKTDA